MILSKLPDTGTTIFTVMSKLAVDYNAINLGQGFPDFKADPLLIELVNKIMQSGRNQYVPMEGLPALREWIGKDINKRYATNIDPLAEVTLMNGATEGVFCAISSLVHADDEVIIFEPAFDIYVPAIILHKAKPVRIKLNEDFHVDWKQVKDSITSRTRMIIINSPHNPCGTCFSKADMLELEAIVKGTNILILSDEVYEHIVFDERKHESILRYPGLFERGVAVFSFGKSLHTTGWRLGYCVAPTLIMKEIRKIHQFVTFSANSPMQYAITEYLNSGLELPLLSQVFQQKRDYFLNLLKESGFRFLPCEGSYFLLADYSAISDKRDIDFAKWLATDIKVASIPLSPFYEDNIDRKLIRLCFSKTEETLAIAADRLRNI
jgi:methionine aminotransferase